MPIKDLVIKFLREQEKLVVANAKLSEETKRKRIRDVRDLIAELERGG